MHFDQVAVNEVNSNYNPVKRRLTMRRDTTIINPRQLYIELGVDELKKLNCPQLGISHFYEFSLGQGKTHELKAVPDGSIDLLFNIGSDKVTTYISGTVFSVKDWNLGDADLCFGVRFQPGQGILPKDLTMDMLVNNDVEIDGNIFGENLTEKIALADNIVDRSRIFKEAYETLVYGRPDLSDKEKINEYLVSRITRAKGCVSMNELVDETNYSACYLRRVFKSYHSISPKQFAQYIRFQILLEKLKTGNMRYDELALECGYYDEAHMMKGFKNYAGITIEQYRKLQEITGRNRI